MVRFFFDESMLLKTFSTSSLDSFDFNVDVRGFLDLDDKTKTDSDHTTMNGAGKDPSQLFKSNRYSDNISYYTSSKFTVDDHVPVRRDILMWGDVGITKLATRHDKSGLSGRQIVDKF
ncbi:hypothetical protein MOUN0_D04214 [Monosporozyma unispora]|nr:hypothetical protein C6P44_002461 [Kazachstania unispora]